MPLLLTIAIALALLLGGYDAILGEDAGDTRQAGGRASGKGAGGKGSAPTGETFAGTGYSFVMVEGWSDRTDDAASVEDLGIEEPGVQAIEVDGVIAAPARKGEFRPNLTIVRTSDGISDDVSAERLATANLETARRLGSVPPGAGGGDVSFGEAGVRPTKLGGEPAAYYEQTAASPAGQIRQRQIYAIEDGTAYALTFGSVAGPRYEASLAKLQKMLGTWAWE